MSKIISVAKFFDHNPLWTLLNQKDGKPTASYKSNTFNGIIECKKCGENAARRGTAGFKCLRCRRTVEVVDGVVSIVEPTSEKELAAQEVGMARDPKKIYDEDEDEDDEEPVPVPVKKTKKKAALTTQEMEDLVPSTKKKMSKKAVAPVDTSDDEEDVTPKKKLFMDLDLLADFAAKTSGNLTEAEMKAKKATLEKKTTRRQIKKTAAEAARDAAEEDITEDGTTTTTTTTTILPIKKEKERSKVTECSGVVEREIRLKPGSSHYCATTKTMFIVD